MEMRIQNGRQSPVQIRGDVGVPSSDILSPKSPGDWVEIKFDKLTFSGLSALLLRHANNSRMLAWAHALQLFVNIRHAREESCQLRKTASKVKEALKEAEGKLEKYKRKTSRLEKARGIVG